ncbi:MAG: aerobic respiration control sensor protein ArcB [Methanoregulaceae archaeon PtaB.Bin056]|nr:MAG: aerobic respiration control sensor protein ArcB [Methanoregulaceae archaeon PtaB.Bin056]
MNLHSEEEADPESQREKIIGLGELSIRKSYYPELQQQQEALKQSEARLRSILQASPVMQFVIDQEHRVISWNRAIETYSGIRADDILGTDGQWKAFYSEKRPVLADIVLDQAFHRLPALYRKFSKSRFVKEGYEATDYFPHMGDTGKWLHATAVPMRDANGVVIGAIETLEDITERKNAAEALKESEKFLDNVVENIPDMIFVKDAHDLRFVRFNRAGEELLGYSREEMYGKNDYDFFPKEEADFFTRQDKIVLEKRQHVDIPEEIIQTRLKGTRILHTKKIMIPDRNGKPAYLLGISEDITERKQAEEEIEKARRRLDSTLKFIETVISAIPVPLFYKDREGRYIGVNNAFVELMGYTSDFYKGKTVMELWPDEYSRVYHDKDLELMKNPQKQVYEYKILDRNGVEHEVIYGKNVFRDETGQVAGIVGAFVDITERKRMEKALQLARNKINLLNTVTFQDIQNAAFSLVAYHELLINLIKDEKAHAFLEKMVGLNQKILDSLNFAKNYQDMGARPPRWQSIEQVFLFAISHLDFLHITHALHVKDLEVYADPLLENVFFHMMQNVLLYGEHASEVTIRYQEKPEGLVLFIEDNGVGIPAEEKHMIFDRGYGKSNGLGLFLAREVLSITGMTIRETGEPGRGARFEIYVPREDYRFTKNPQVS